MQSWDCCYGYRCLYWGKDVEEGGGLDHEELQKLRAASRSDWHVLTGRHCRRNQMLSKLSRQACPHRGSQGKENLGMVQNWLQR